VERTAGVVEPVKRLRMGILSKVNDLISIERDESEGSLGFAVGMV